MINNIKVVEFLLQCMTDLYLPESNLNIREYLEDRIEDPFQINLFLLLLKPANLYKTSSMCREFLNLEKFNYFTTLKKSFNRLLTEASSSEAFFSLEDAKDLVELSTKKDNIERCFLITGHDGFIAEFININKIFLALVQKQT